MPDSSQSRYRWYVLTLATVIFLIVFGMGAACMPVLFSEIAAELGLGLVQLGTVWGATFVAGIPVLFFAGLLSDRFGVRRTLAAACLLAGVFGSLRGLSDSFTSLVVTSLLFGSAIEMIPTIILKTTSLWFQGRSMGMVQGIVCAGMGIGFMLGAMLSATVMSPLLGGWRNVLFVYGAASVLLSLLWLLTVRDPAQTVAPYPVGTPPLRQALARVVRNRSVWLIAITAFGFAGNQQGLTGYLPLYLRNSGWPAASADGAQATINATAAIAVIPLLMLSDKLGLRKAILMPGLIVSAIGTGLLAVVTGTFVWPLAALIGVFRNTCWAIIATLIIETRGIGREYTGTGGGLVLSISRVGYVIAPPLGNSLASIQPGLPFVFWAALCVLAVISFIFVSETGYKSRRTYASEH